MVNTELMPLPKQQYFRSSDGSPLVGGKVYTYAAGTNTPKATFANAEGTIQQQNPIILNSRGEPDNPIYWSGAYKVSLYDASGNLVYTVDDYAPQAARLRDDLGAIDGANLVKFAHTTDYDSGTVGDKLRQIPSVKDLPYGAVGDGATNDTAAFTAARAASPNGKYLIPPGTYLVDTSPDVWSDSFIAPYAGTYLRIGGVTYDVSGSFGSGWRNLSNTQRYLTWSHARTGKTIAIWSDGEQVSDSHRIFLPWDVRRDSHYFIASPETLGGSCDMLWRRSQANADAGGNRFNMTFEEGTDRLLVSFATSASGSPGFDSAMRIWGGTSAKMDFPALQPTFRQGWAAQNRAETGFKLVLTIGADRHHIEKSDGTARHMTFKEDGSVGFFGSGGTTRPTISGSRGGNAAVTALLTALSAMGLITDATTA